MTLSKKSLKALATASPIPIEAAFGLLKNNFPQGGWVSTSNRYRNDPKQIDADTESGNVVVPDLIEYVAASAVGHCADGWSYLSHALEAHTRGDPAAARHLAYYAELRGALAFLASEGVGIFDAHHFVLDSAGGVHAISDRSSHAFTWSTLDRWGNGSDASKSISAFVRPGGIALTDWVTALLPGATPAAIAGGWLRDWGLDLNSLSADRRARNESSYRPAAAAPTTPLSAADASRFLCEAWRLFEPPAFGVIDRYLLRLALESAYRGTTGNDPAANAADFSSHVTTALRTLTITGAPADTWHNFLARKTSPSDPELLVDARKQTPITDSRNHLQVIARASLMLRLATGSASKLTQGAGYSRSDLEFWWHPLGVRRCLWSPHERPGQVTDLWVDARDAIDALEAWTTTNPGASPKAWRADTLSTVFQLSGCDLVGLWGLGL